MDEKLGPIPRDMSGVARHEAGHAVMAALLGYPAGCIAFDPAAGAGWAESSFTLPVFSRWCSRATMERCAADAAFIALAGQAAVPEYPSQDDLITARRLASLVAPDASQALLGYWAAQVRAIMAGADAQRAVNLLATALHQHSTMTARQVRQAMGPIKRIRLPSITNVAIIAAHHDLPGDPPAVETAGEALARKGLRSWRWFRWLASLSWH